MAKLVAVNIKRKDAEVAGHGFSMFLDPKRIKLQLQEEVEISEMMEEEEPLAGAGADACDAPPVVVVVQVQPTMLMPSPLPLQPAQGQEAAVHDSTVSTESGNKSSEPPLAAEQAAPMDMDMEENSWQCQPQRRPVQRPDYWSWSGFF